MIRHPEQGYGDRNGIPRESGDDPPRQGGGHPEGGYSPRERG